jgi:predicted DNA-binding transcriptional regulator YafY
VPFTPDELLAIAFGADLLAPLEGTVFHDSVQSALGKIRAGLGPELSGYLERLAETFRVLPGPHKRYAEYRETIQVLNDGLLAQQSVSMRYKTGSTGALHDRVLDPYRIWYRSGGLYVIGHDHRSGEIRTFAVDRIQRIEATSEPFQVDPAFDFDEYTGSAFGVFNEPATHVLIRFEPHWRTHVQERTWHASQRLEEGDDGRIELHMDVGGTAELCSWVLSFGNGAEVLEPVSLREEVRAELERASARYAAPPSGSPSD